MKAVIFTGLQASGKSTFYRRRFADTHIRINLDMLKKRWRETVLLHACLGAKLPFVVDNTNISVAERARYIPLARAHRYEIIGYFFETLLEECLWRNSKRPKPILEVALHSFHQRLEVPSLSEGYDILYQVFSANDEFYVKELKV
jgi:predicted kinase